MEEIRFADLIEKQAQRYGERCFITCSLTGQKVSYTQLDRFVKEQSEQLRRLGVERGDKVLLFMDNSVEFAVLYFAVTGCGAVAVPANTLLKEKELLYLLKDAQVRAVITEPLYWGILRGSAGDLVETVHETAPFGREIQVLLLKECQEDENAPCSQREDTAMLLYTSGTTGNPKGVILSYANLLAKAEHIQEAHGLTQEDVCLCVLPWFHINGLVITLITPLYSGGQIVIGGKFSVSRFWKDIENYCVTWFSGVPTMYSHLLAKGIPEDRDYSSLRFARSASSPLPVSVLERFESICQVPVIESYGITEGCSQITTNPMPPKARKSGSVGLPFGNRIKIVDNEGRELPCGQVGEVLMQGDNITCGYYHKEEETKKAFSGDWFHSGDLGYQDEDGYLFLDGRIKELINRAGEKFPPREVDEILYQMEGVELAAVAGVPDAVYGEEVAAFIKKKDGAVLDAQMVQEFCKDKIASYKVPRKVYFLEDLPKGGNGKIQRLKLVERYKKGEFE